MEAHGLKCARGEMVTDVVNYAGFRVAHDVGYPVLIRPSFTLGGSGGGIATDEADLRVKCRQRPQRQPGA